jgi:hypothetical protein
MRVLRPTPKWKTEKNKNGDEVTETLKRGRMSKRMCLTVMTTLTTIAILVAAIIPL